MNTLREQKQHGTLLYPMEIYCTPPHTSRNYVSYHWHEEAEWIHVLSGTLFLTIGGRSYTGKKGDLFFIQKEQLHSMYISGEETSYYALIFPLESLAFSPEDYVQQKYLDPLFRRELLFPEHWPPGTPEQKAMQTEFLRIRELHENRPSGYELAVRTALLQLVSAMVSLGKMMPGSLPTGEPEEKNRLRKEVLLYLEKHYSEPISLAQIGEHFHMSPKYFCYWFKIAFGKAFTDYLNCLRMEKAALLLLTSGLKIVDIALAVGFENTSYFIRRFREMYRATPSQYRRLAGR